MFLMRMGYSGEGVANTRFRLDVESKILFNTDSFI